MIAGMGVGRQEGWYIVSGVLSADELTELNNGCYPFSLARFGWPANDHRQVPGPGTIDAHVHQRLAAEGVPVSPEAYRFVQANDRISQGCLAERGRMPITDATSVLFTAGPS